MRRFLLARRVILAALVLALVSCHRAAGDDGWFTDIESAKKTAVRTKKDIFMFVRMSGTGSTMDLMSDSASAILRSKTFLEKEKSDYVLLEYNIDAEQFQAAQSDNKAMAALRKVQKTMALYQVQVAPSVFLLTKEGYCIGSFTFDGIRDVNLLFEAIHKFDSNALKIKELLGVINGKNPASEKVQAIEELFQATPQAQSLLLAGLSQKLISLDPKNSSGFVPKHFVFSADATAEKYVIDNQIEKAANHLAKSAASKLIEGEDRQYLYYRAAIFYANEQNPKFEKSVSMLNKSIEAAPESANVGYLRQQLNLIEQIKNQIENGIPPQFDEPDFGPEQPPIEIAPQPGEVGTNVEQAPLEPAEPAGVAAQDNAPVPEAAPAPEGAAQ